MSSAKAEVTPRKLNMSTIMAIGRDIVTSPVTTRALSPCFPLACGRVLSHGSCCRVMYVSAILSIQADLAPTLDARSPPSKPHADRGREGKRALFGWQKYKKKRTRHGNDRVDERGLIEKKGIITLRKSPSQSMLPLPKPVDSNQTLCSCSKKKSPLRHVHAPAPPAREGGHAYIGK
ncbi:hypothetical protein BGZ61DRAFT_25537 [Ilyonectria robusta]|uniref:uncharacterized protein n=1 Tax=Ilyonectria robusta TaxID=1079257 RepID=UPI001E8E57C6|nr:uncharacterized protein BGZ61DRAFT_25537 [Ilyonectria robusta]KAH8737949.1 hypothetical protein BGZ61DRAFT_25537 [Ilyonectria robusta]